MCAIRGVGAMSQNISEWMVAEVLGADGLANGAHAALV
jgi:hypothetical protein